MKDKKNLLIIGLFSLSFLSFFISIFIFKNGEDNKLVSLDEDELTNKYEEIDVKDPIVQDALAKFYLINLVPDGLKSSSEISAYSSRNESLYSYEKYNIKDIGTKDLIGTAINVLYKDEFKYCSDTLSYDYTLDDINKAISYVINDESVTIEDILNSNYNTYGHLSVNNDIITHHATCNRDNKLVNNYLFLNNYKAEKNNSSLIVYQRVVFADLKEAPPVDGNERKNISVIFNFYKTFDRIDGIVESGSAPTYQNYNTYKVVFKLINDSYYFDSYSLEYDN